ncbi:MAG: MmcQ/YjbR family DNA-binding protein [Vulcanimicrobiaceae bacterium]
MATLADVRHIALGLPGTTEERTRRGWAAWIVNKKFFVWERELLPSDLAALGKKAPKGIILGIRTAHLEMKDVLLANDPKIFFTTPHFDGYPAVLAQLEKIGVGKLREVIVEAWLARAGKRAVAEFLQANEGPKRAAPAKKRR